MRRTLDKFKKPEKRAKRKNPTVKIDLNQTKPLTPKEKALLAYVVEVIKDPKGMF